VVLRPYRNFIRQYELLQHLLHLATPLSRYILLHEGQLALVPPRQETKQLVFIQLHDKLLLRPMGIALLLVYTLHREAQQEMELALQAT
jgi:hypothetical protein